MAKEFLTIREQQFLIFLRKSKLRKKSEIARAMDIHRQRVQQLAERLISKKYLPGAYFEDGRKKK